jgi:hypothetical protein
VPPAAPPSGEPDALATPIVQLTPLSAPP